MKQTKKRMTLKFDTTTHYKLKYIAKSKYTTMSNLIIFIINNYISSYEKENGKINLKN